MEGDRLTDDEGGDVYRRKYIIVLGDERQTSWTFFDWRV